MADTVIDTMVVKLMGDGLSYVRMLQDAQRYTVSATNTIKKQLDTIGSSFKAFGSGLTSLGVKYSAAITAPLTALAGVAVRDAMQFEAALSRMEGLVGLNKTEIAGFSEEIKKLAVVTGKMPLELASAMENITSSGIKGEAALETLTVTAKAAAGGLGEVRSVSDTVTSAMNAYGVANLSATRATDILVAAVREGKAEADSFAPVLGNVLPIANEMGISFEEAAGSIAYLTLATGSASTAATQYQNILAQTIKLNEKHDSGKVLKQAGVDIKQFQADVANNGLLDSLMKLKDTLAGKGLTLKDAFPDVQAMTAALQLTGANAAKAKEVIDNVGKAGGSVDQAFGAAAQTKAFKFNQQMAEGKVILLELGDMFSEVMAKLMGWATSGIELWKGMNEGAKKFTVNALAIAAAVGPLLVGAGLFVTLLGTMAGGLSTLIGITVGLASALAAVAGFLTSIPGLIIGVGALIAYEVGLGTTALNVFKDGWTSLKDYVGPAIQGIKDAISGGDLELAFKIGWTQIEVGWMDFTDFLHKTWVDAMNSITQVWQQTISNIGSMIASDSLIQDILGVKDPVEFQKQLTRLQKGDMNRATLQHTPNAGLEDKRNLLQELIGKAGGSSGGGTFDEAGPAATALTGGPQMRPDLGIPAEQTKKVHVQVDFKTVGAGSGAHLDLLSEFFSGRPEIAKKVTIAQNGGQNLNTAEAIAADQAVQEARRIKLGLPASEFSPEQQEMQAQHQRERAHFQRYKGTYSYEETIAEQSRMDMQEQGMRHQMADSKQLPGGGSKSLEGIEKGIQQLVIIGTKELEKEKVTMTAAGLDQ